MKLRTLFIIWLTLSTNAYAQEVVELTFDQSLEIAMRQAYAFQSQETSFQSDYLRLMSQEASLKSNASMSFLLPSFDQSITEQYSFSTDSYRFVDSQRLRFQATMRINQPLITGGNFSLNANLYHLNQYGKSKKYVGRIYLAFEQPILQPNEQKNEIEQARMRLTQTQFGHATTRLRTISSQSGTFYDIFRFQNQIDLKEEIFEQYSEIYTGAEERNRAGRLEDTELLQLQVDLENLESDLLRFRADRQNREATFKQNIGLDQELGVKAIAELDIIPLSVTLEEAKNRGLENRTEMRTFAFQVRSQEMSIEKVKSDGRIKGEIKITFGFDNSVDGDLFYNGQNPFNGSSYYFDPLRNIFQNYDRTRSIVLTLKMPVLDWGRNAARLEEEYISFERLKNSQINTARNIEKEITDAYYTLEETKERLVVTKAARSNAQTVYDMSVAQFNEGQISAQNLRLAKNAYISGVDNYLNSYVEYQSAVVNLTRQTMWDFQNEISITDDEMFKTMLSGGNSINNNN